MINQEQVESGLVYFFGAMCPGWEIFLSVDPASRPASPCIELHIDRLEQLGRQWFGIDENGIDKIVSDYEIEIISRAYGNLDGATKYYPMAILEEVGNFERRQFDPAGTDPNTARHYELVRETLLREYGLVPASFGPTLDNSGTNDNIFELRAIKKITFNYRYVSPNIDIGVIEEIETESEFMQGDDVVLEIPILSRKTI